MSFRLDWKNFKKTAVDKDIATLKHARGHEIRIALKSLPPGTRKLLESLPTHMADGGKVADIEESSPKIVEDEMPMASTMPPAQPVQAPDTVEQIQADVAKEPPQSPYAKLYEDTIKTMETANPVIKQRPDLRMMAENDALDIVERRKNWDEAQQQMSVQKSAQEAERIAATNARRAQLGLPPIEAKSPAPSDTAGQSAPNQDQGLAAAAGPANAPAPSDTPSVMDSYQGAMQKGFDLQNSAIDKQARAEQALSADLQRQYAAQAAQAKLQMEQMQAVQQDAAKEREAFLHDVQKGYIQPNRVFENMGTGQKVMAAIGLMLSGAGSAAAKVPNAAENFLKDQVNRDIAAQEKNLNTKESLLRNNLDYYKNKMDAMNMTRVQINDYYAHMIDQAKAKNMSPQAQATADAAKGKLLQQNASLIAQMGTQPRDMGDYMKFLEVSNPEKAKELKQTMVPGLGFALTPKDADELKKLSATTNTAKDSIGELIKISQKPGKSLSMTDRERADTIRKTLQGVLREPILGPGTVNDSERKMLEDIVANPTKVFSLDQNTRTRLQELMKRLDVNLRSEAQARGISGMSSSSNSSGNKIQFTPKK